MHDKENKIDGTCDLQQINQFMLQAWIRSGS